MTEQSNPEYKRLWEIVSQLVACHFLCVLKTCVDLELGVLI